MLRKILDLPDDILDRFMEELLPSIPLDQNIWGILPEPLDLGRLLVVCKTFQRLALPWVWKRVDIRDTDPHLRRGPWRWQHLCKYPGLASYTRSLSVQIRPGGTEFNMPDYLQTINAFVSHMMNVEVLQLCGDGHPNEDDELHTTLITRPRLHTLITINYTPTTFQQLSRFSGVKRLQMSNECEHEVLLEMAPFVEYLAVPIYVDWTSLPIPWTTLRELTVYDDHDVGEFDNWDLILDNFSAWKTSFPNTPCPLTEVFIANSYYKLTLEHVQTFSVIGTQLCALSLGYFEEINESILTYIVDSFPQLRELRLFTFSMMGWNVELRTITEALGRLSTLKHLHWNYVSQDSERLTWRRLMPGCHRNLLPLMAEACKTLEMVVFHHDFPEDHDDSGLDFWDSFAVVRNGPGGYERVSEAHGDTWSRFTSGWQHNCI